MQTIADWATSFLMAMAFFIAIIVYLAHSVHSVQRDAATWSREAEGIVERVEHGGDTHTDTRGYDTSVHFQDGRSFRLTARYGTPYPPGTRVRILVNRLGERRMESVAS